MKTFGKITVTLIALGTAYYVFGRDDKPEPKKVEPKLDPVEYVPDENSPVVEMFLNGAAEGDELPLIFLLHADGSSPDAAIKLISTIGPPCRVVAPTGRYSKDGGRYFVNPAFTGLSYAIAMRKELARLVDVLEDTIKASTPLPKPSRALAVGLDSSGALAVGLGLQAPTRVRYAWGTGGVVPPSWVLPELPPMNNMPRPQLRKVTYGEAKATDEETAALAVKRKNDLLLTTQIGGVPVVGPLSEDAARAWMIADIETFLLTA